MVVKGEDNDLRVVTVNCRCGCDEAIQLKRFKEDGYADTYLSLLAGEFGCKQRGIIRTIGHRIKLAIKMLLGKEYLLAEIVLNDIELEEYIACLKTLKNF